ncbi:MAG: GNAT family N-acetyltransferase [Acidobacteriota bacterium]|nr:GNAT family N-acetyltransferase [Acidobacteriota bacterium]
MARARPMALEDVGAVVELIAARLGEDARRNQFVNGALDAAPLRDALTSSLGQSVVAEAGRRIVGHLSAVILDRETYGNGAWVGPDAASFDDADTLAALYARAGQDWIDAGALEHYVWVLDDAERTAPWLELGFARMHERGVRSLADLVVHEWPRGYSSRLGGPGDLDWAVDLGAEIDRAQAAGPSFSLDVGGDERAELAETLEDPEVRYFLAEFAGRPVGQCITFPLPARRGSFDDTLHLSAVAVREDHRGRGVATALVDGALERARRRGFRYVETNWRVTNRDAARYWTGYGFHPTYVRLHRTIGSS